MNRYIKIFLALSLFLNLLMLGVTFGCIGKKVQALLLAQHHPLTMTEITSALAPKKQKNLEPLIQKVEEEIKVQRDQLVVERRKAFELLQVTPFNKDAYLAQIKVTEELHAKIVDNTTAVVLKIAEQSSDAERATISQMMIERQNALSSGR